MGLTMLGLSKTHIWLVQRKEADGISFPFLYFDSRNARETARYFNGFSHSKNNAQFSVKKFVEAK